MKNREVKELQDKISAQLGIMLGHLIHKMHTQSLIPANLIEIKKQMDLILDHVNDLVGIVKTLRKDVDKLQKNRKK